MCSLIFIVFVIVLEMVNQCNTFYLVILTQVSCLSSIYPQVSLSHSYCLLNFFSKKKMNVWILFFLEIFTSEVAWPNFSNNITLKCHKGNVVMQNYTDQCEFKPKCVLEYRDQSILFFCSGKYMLNDTGIICIYWKFVNYFKRWY